MRRVRPAARLLRWWSTIGACLTYDSHTRKAKRVPVAKAKLQGYELATALLLSDRDGAPLGALCQELRSAEGWHSSRHAQPDPEQGQWRLDALAAPLEFIAGLPLGREAVPLIDREADSVVHYRAWAEAGRRFVVRADDRLVSVPGPEGVLQETSLAVLAAEMEKSGALAASGTQTLTPTTPGTATYTLTCSNAAGTSTAASASLTVTAAASHNGGGRLDWVAVIFLAAIGVARVRLSPRVLT